jgi:hypothetical protein
VAYYYGISFGPGATANINFTGLAAWWFRFEDCKLTLSTGTGARISVGNNNTGVHDQQLELVNTTLKFGNVAQSIVLRAPLLWNGGSIDAAGSAPTALFLAISSGAGSYARVAGVDLSHLSSGKSLVEADGATCNFFTFENCKLGASVGITAGAFAGQGGIKVDVINCDSGDTNYRYHKGRFQGTVNQEATIVRSGGASDGTTTISRKMVSSADSKVYSPLESDWTYIWNEVTGSSVTVSIPVVTDNVTLKDDEAWIEVEYLGTSGFPKSLFASDRIATILTTPANQATDAVSSWTTTGLTTPVKQTLSVAVTPQEKGPIRARVCLAKASTTLYYDPKLSVA